MNKQCGWVSEYRRKKFFENQKLRKEKNRLNSIGNFDSFNNKTIAVMIDLEGTVDFIDDLKAKRFVRQLDILRNKFDAKTATISISTHYNNSCEIKKILDIFARNLSSCIKIGISFYYGGTYDYDNNIDTLKDYGFNYDKVETFCNYYTNNIDSRNQWFAIVDDSISDEIYKNYQNNHPMLLARPSQSESKSLNNNFMSIATTAKGFDGVIEIFDKYIDSVQNLSPDEILESQRNMINHLSGWDLSQKVLKRDYAFLERYFSEGFADESDYNDILTYLIYTNQNQTPSKEELRYLKIIFEIMAQHFNSKDEQQNVERVLKFQRNLELS